MLSERYTIPAMGGVEVERGSTIGTTAFVKVPGVGVVMLPETALEPVKPTPPAPPEPPEGWWVYSNGLLWRHVAVGWVSWQGSQKPRTWAYLVESYRDRWPEQWQILMPVPDLLELPWEAADGDGDKVRVLGTSDAVYITNTASRHTSAQAVRGRVEVALARDQVLDLIRALYSAIVAREDR